MISNQEQLKAALIESVGTRSISSDDVDSFIKSVFFLDGKLRSFQGDNIKAVLTVIEFEDLLNKIGGYVTLGDVSGRPYANHKKYSSIIQSCEPSVGYYCD